MVGKTSLFILAVFIVSCTFAQDCNLVYNFLGQIREQLNNKARLSQFARILDIPASTASDFQKVIYEYYRKNDFLQIKDLAFDRCSSQFDALINNALLAGNVTLYGWYLYPAFPCYDERNTYNWNDTWLSSSNGKSISLAPVSLYILTSIRAALNTTAKGLTYASAFTYNCPLAITQYVAYVKSQMSLSYCSINDAVFQWINKAFNNPMNLQSLAANLGVSTSGYDNFTSIVNSYFTRSPAAAQDFLTNCGPQLNRLVANFLKSSSINVGDSVFLKNASLPAVARTCKTARDMYTFNNNVLSWSNGSYNLGLIMNYVSSFINTPIQSVGTLGSILDSRLQECRNSLPGKTSLVDSLFLFIRKALTGQN
jgi:hypothetical protein